MPPLWLTVVLVSLPLVALGQGSEVTLDRVKRGGGKRRQGGGRGHGCGEWVPADCVPLLGSCGLGTQEMSREGTCKVRHKNQPCKLPCETVDGEIQQATFPLEATIDIDEEPSPSPEQTLDVDTGDRRKGDRRERKQRRKNRKANKEEKKKNKKDKACRYEKGIWTSCDADNVKSRTDRLKPGGGASCNATQTMTRPCRRKARRCQYEFGTWGECEEGKRTRVRTLKSGEEGKRTRVRTLKSGEEGKRTRVRTLKSGGDECQASKRLSKPCFFRDGSERCFYGPWGDFSSCQNGVRTKIRPVVYGGEQCQRKGVKTRPC